jgi:hypothetical protein
MSNNGLAELIPEVISAVTATPSIEIGTERWDNGRKYIYMYNKSTSTASVQLGVVYSAASSYSITVSSVADERCAGVVIHSDIPALNYGWVCTKGHVDVLAASACATGMKVVMSTDGYFNGVEDVATSGWTGVICGICTGNTEATATMGAFINVG